MARSGEWPLPLTDKKCQNHRPQKPQNKLTLFPTQNTAQKIFLLTLVEFPSSKNHTTTLPMVKGGCWIISKTYRGGVLRRRLGVIESSAKNKGVVGREVFVGGDQSEGFSRSGER